MRTNEMMNEPAARTRDGVRPEPPASGPFSGGQVLAGAYEVGPVLGAGGMGVVYAAHDLLLDRMVAIKAPLLPEFADALAREAQAMAAVHHPNLVTIHAAGREGDVGFIVMERLFGMTLEERIAEAWEAGRPIPLEEALAQLAGVTDALSAIHGAGAAHRDVKSGNVMLSGRRVVLTDFGLATPEVLARRGTPLAGSVDYMAPELIMGSVKQGQGPLVDLYALGVVLFEVIAGRRPFGGDTVNAVLAAHVHRPAPDLRSFRADVPAELAMLVGDLLAKAPEERPASAEAVLWQLGAIRADLPQPSGQVAPRLSVLIVDDDPAIGAVLKRNLEWTLPRLAADVVTSPTEALDRLAHHTYDLVVVDLVMPDMSGVELCMQLRAQSPRPVAAAMSSCASPEDVAVLRSLGVRAFVPKDEGFVRHMCAVIGEIRRAKLGTPTLPSRGRART